MPDDTRATPREPIALPVKLADGRVGITRDISASGLYLEFEGHAPTGGGIEFEMQVPEARMTFRAHGWIVRVERHDGRTGLAVKLLDARLEPMERPAQAPERPLAGQQEEACPTAGRTQRPPARRGAIR